MWVAGTQPLLLGEQEAAKLRAADAAAGRPAFRREPPPYKPEFEARRLEFVARRGVDDPMARCLLSGVPRVTTRPLPFQIVQTKDLVVVLYKAHHAFRIIPTDGRPHPDDHEPSYLGDSVARWDGDTLVVDVVGFNEKTWLAGTGTIHSEQLHVVERYTRDTADSIVYDVTIEDPVAFTKPWRQQEILHLRPGERSASTSASRTIRICSGSRSCCRTNRCSASHRNRTHYNNAVLRIWCLAALICLSIWGPASRTIQDASNATQGSSTASAYRRCSIE